MEDVEKYIDEIYCIYKDSKDSAAEFIKENRRQLEKMDDIVRWHVSDIKKYTKVFLISVIVIGLLQGVSMIWMVHWFKKNLDERLTFSYVVLRKIALVQDEQDKILKDLQNLQKKENIIEQKK